MRRARRHLLRAFVAACTMRVVSCGRSTMPLLRAFSATCTMRVVACGCVVARCRPHTLGKCRIVGMACRCTRVVTSAGLVAGCCSVVTILACNSGTFECTSVDHSIEHHVSIHASKKTLGVSVARLLRGKGRHPGATPPMSTREHALSTL